QSVPVVGRRHFDDIEIALFQHVAVIVEKAGALVRCLSRRDDIGGIVEHFGSDVAERESFHGGDLNEPQEIRLAIPSDADQPDPPRFGLSEGQRGRGSGGEEMSAVHGRLLPRKYSVLPSVSWSSGTFCPLDTIGVSGLLEPTIVYDSCILPLWQWTR